LVRTKGKKKHAKRYRRLRKKSQHLKKGNEFDFKFKKATKSNALYDIVINTKVEVIYITKYNKSALEPIKSNIM
jgi:hypothetical protein